MKWLKFLFILSVIMFYSCTKSSSTDPEPPPPTDNITVTLPQQGVLFYWDSTAVISWMVEGDVDQVNLYYRIADDSSWIFIDSNISTLSYNWTVPRIITNEARVMAVSSSDTSVYDLNPGNFILDRYIETNLVLLTCDSFFYMGSDSTEVGHLPDEAPVHQVSLSIFYISANEVTNAEYRTFCNSSGYPSPPSPNFPGMDNYFDSFPAYPVVMVSWYDAARYCNWLSQRDGFQPQYDTLTWDCSFSGGYRLPTEAEWEFAARGGLYQNPYPWGEDDPGQRCNWSGMDSFTYTSPVGSFNPNAYGLYDLSGNVLEWTNDYYSASYYENSPQQDPHGPASGTYRVIRGGSWFDGAENLRCACRNPSDPDFADVLIKANTLGFRIVRGF